MFKNKQNNVLLECGKHLIVMHELQLFVAPFVKSERAKLIEKKKRLLCISTSSQVPSQGVNKRLGVDQLLGVDKNTLLIDFFFFSTKKDMKRLKRRKSIEKGKTSISTSSTSFRVRTAHES